MKRQAAKHTARAAALAGAIRTMVLAALVALCAGCSIKIGGLTMGYSFRNTNLPAAAQTFSVGFFRNDAPMVAPTLSAVFTEALKDRLSRQTRLSQISEGGDLAFEGEIVDYTTAPSSIGGGGGEVEGALRNRLTITVRVRFANVHEPQWDFPNRTFSAFADYDASRMLQEVEGGLIEEIVEALVDNIFNATVTNW